MGSRTRRDLIQSLRALGLTENRARTVVEAFFTGLRVRLEAGTPVVLPGFGSFKWRERKARRARNPRTGESVELPLRKVLVFQPSVRLKKKLNYPLNKP